LQAKIGKFICGGAALVVFGGLISMFGGLALPSPPCPRPWGGPSSEKNYIFVPKMIRFGALWRMQILTGRKHGQSLEDLGHGLYGSIVKRSLQNSAKINGQTEGGERLHHRPPILNTPQLRNEEAKRRYFIQWLCVGLQQSLIVVESVNVYAVVMCCWCLSVCWTSIFSDSTRCALDTFWFVLCVFLFRTDYM